MVGDWQWLGGGGGRGVDGSVMAFAGVAGADVTVGVGVEIGSVDAAAEAVRDAESAGAVRAGVVPQVAILGKRVSAVGGGLEEEIAGKRRRWPLARGVGVKIGAGKGSELGGEVAEGATVRAVGESGNGGVVARWAQGRWQWQCCRKVDARVAAVVLADIWGWSKSTADPAGNSVGAAPGDVAGSGVGAAMAARSPVGCTPGRRGG